MSKHDELVKALRWCSVDEYVPCTGCPMNEETHGTGCFNIMHQRAAAAIEELTTVLKEADKKQAYQHERICELTAENEELKDEVKRLQDKLCDWCSVCQKERRNPDDCELLGENPVMYGPSGAKMEVQEA